MSGFPSNPVRAPVRIHLLLPLAMALAGGCGLCSSTDEPDLSRRTPVAYPGEVVFDGRPLAVLGDTQRATWFERFILGRHVNDRERKLLIDSLAGEGAGALVLVGDMVNPGSDPQQWAFFDALMDPIRKRDIPVLALLGNHEYDRDASRARSLVNLRFPRLASREYDSERYGRLGLVLLNSNKDRLGAEAWAGQLRWYLRQLEDLDGDDGVYGVLVFLHHPPFTRSRTVAGDRRLATDFVAGFARAHKTLAIISGHAHGYECTRRSGKYYIVTAGGGGPLQARDGAASCPDDDRNRSGGSGRLKGSAFFNYLLVGQDETAIRIEVKGLAEGGSQVEPLALMEIPFARR